MKILLLSGIKNIYYLENHMIKIIHLKINWEYIEKKEDNQKIEEFTSKLVQKRNPKKYISVY